MRTGVVFFLSVVGWSAGLGAAEQVALQDLQKHDFSIRLKVAHPRPEERCFLLPEVNQALSRVQQKVRLLQARLKVLQCYSPELKAFAKGSTVQLELAEKGTLAPQDFQKVLKAEGFQVFDKKAGIYIHASSDKGEIRNIAVEALP